MQAGGVPHTFPPHAHTSSSTAQCTSAGNLSLFHISAITATGHAQHSQSCDPIPDAWDLWVGGMLERGAASGDCAICFVLLGNAMLCGSPVISPAMISMYLKPWYASFYNSAEKFVQTEGPNSPFLLHKNKKSGKKGVSAT